ncbi:MAG: Transcriptional regulator [Caulobacter sp.]|nr:Transcriptional regulator [Caulobacter sp.]
MNVRARQKAATQASILQAALEIFSEKGFDGASTREIAAHAGVHHALIKYHFTSKDALWRAAVTFLFQRQAAELSLPAPNDPAHASYRDFARAVIRAVVLYSARHPEHARLMVQESVRDSERFRWAADEFIVQTRQAAEAFILLCQREGILPKVSVPALAYIFVGAAQLFYTLAPEVRRVWGIDPSDPEVIEAHAEALTAVLVR